MTNLGTNHMLAESELAHVDANPFQKQADASQEVSKSLIVDDTFLDSRPDGHPLDGRLARELDMTVEEVKFSILNLAETVMLLSALGINNLNFISDRSSFKRNSPV